MTIAMTYNKDYINKIKQNLYNIISKFNKNNKNVIQCSKNKKEFDQIQGPLLISL